MIMFVKGNVFNPFFLRKLRITT